MVLWYADQGVIAIIAGPRVFGTGMRSTSSVFGLEGSQASGPLAGTEGSLGPSQTNDRHLFS